VIEQRAVASIVVECVVAVAVGIAVVVVGIVAVTIAGAAGDIAMGENRR